MNDELLLLKYLKALDAIEKIRDALPESESARSAWVGLTDDDLRELGFSSRPRWWPALEAKLKEKNT